MVVGVCDGLIGYEPIASRTDQTWDLSRSDRLEIPPSQPQSATQTNSIRDKELPETAKTGRTKASDREGREKMDEEIRTGRSSQCCCALLGASPPKLERIYTKLDRLPQ